MCESMSIDLCSGDGTPDVAQMPTIRSSDSFDFVDDDQYR